jgi:hypothetical protein
VNILFEILLVVAALAVLSALLLNRRKPAAPDPRIELIAQFEAGLMAFIRERYKCTDEAARQVRSRYLEWEMDAIPTLAMEEDGKLIMDTDTVDVIDRCALKTGLRPAPKGGS